MRAAERNIDRCKGPFLKQETVRALTVNVRARDLALGIDPDRKGGTNARAWKIHCRKRATLEEKTVVGVPSHNGTLRVDSKRNGVAGATWEGNTERNKRSLCQQEAVKSAAIVIGSHDFARIIDPGCQGLVGAREGDRDRGERI